jgi:hypothetical protein
MTRFLWSSYILLWLIVAILTFLVLLIYRQYGRSILPAKERLQLAGLDIGAKVGPLSATDGNGTTEIPVSVASSGLNLRVLLLATSACPICAKLSAEVGTLKEHRADVEYWWIQTGEAKQEPIPEGWQMVLDRRGSVHQALDVPAIPYAYAVDTTGTVRAKGLMNGINDLVELIDRASTGPNTSAEPAQTADR